MLLPHAPQMPGGGKARPLGDGFHIETAVGKNVAREIDPHQVDVVDDADAGMLAKQTR